MSAFLSLNTGALGLGDIALDEKIRLAKAHGFGGVDVGIGANITAADADAIRGKLSAAGLRAAMFGMPVGLYASDADFDAGLSKLAIVAPLAKRAGVLRTGCYMMCASKDRDYKANLAWHVERFGRIVNILRPHGIELGIEFLGEHLIAKIGGHPFIYNLPGMARLFRETGPGAGVIFDVFHWYCSGGTSATLRGELAGIPITCVHLNDAMASRSRLEQIDNERQLPGETGVIDLGGALAAIQQAGFDGPMMVEPFKPWTAQFASMGAEAACAKIAAIVRPMLKASQAG